MNDNRDRECDRGEKSGCVIQLLIKLTIRLKSLSASYFHPHRLHKNRDPSVSARAFPSFCSVTSSLAARSFGRGVAKTMDSG